eukprot:TRINITY_DN3831_c2_g1_i1.p1 TRINITY_DN3831_c2_g1~~TRINITY_DN3831_c2_g1_i1.p1  ORF type:complete len:424 (+),score=112.01 TRINITY_DN3831_c2_g1_i1:121-1272(+)
MAMYLTVSSPPSLPPPPPVSPAGACGQTLVVPPAQYGPAAGGCLVKQQREAEAAARDKLQALGLKAVGLAAAAARSERIIPGCRSSVQRSPSPRRRRRDSTPPPPAADPPAPQGERAARSLPCPCPDPPEASLRRLSVVSAATSMPPGVTEPSAVVAALAAPDPCSPDSPQRARPSLPVGDTRIPLDLAQHLDDLREAEQLPLRLLRLKARLQASLSRAAQRPRGSRRPGLAPDPRILFPDRMGGECSEAGGREGSPLSALGLSDAELKELLADDPPLPEGSGQSTPVPPANHIRLAPPAEARTPGSLRGSSGPPRRPYRALPLGCGYLAVLPPRCGLPAAAPPPEGDNRGGDVSQCGTVPWAARQRVLDQVQLAMHLAGQMA